MKHTNKRLMGIVDELTMYLFSVGGTSISIQIQEWEHKYQLTIKSNYSSDKKEKLDKLIKVLKYPRQEEMEEYCWELAGDSDVGSEMYLVGMMINLVEAKILQNEVELYLCKDK